MSLFDLVPPKHSAGVATAEPPAPPATHAAAQTAPTVHPTAAATATTTATPTASPTATATATANPTAIATAAPTGTDRTLYFSGDENGPFHKVEGAPEREVMQVDKFGATLMVEAYVVLWLLLMGWIGLLWRKQAGLNVRLDGLEQAIDKAAGARAPEKAQAKEAPSAEKAKA